MNPPERLFRTLVFHGTPPALQQNGLVRWACHAAHAAAGLGACMPHARWQIGWPTSIGVLAKFAYLTVLLSILKQPVKLIVLDLSSRWKA